MNVVMLVTVVVLAVIALGGGVLAFAGAGSDRARARVAAIGKPKTPGRSSKGTAEDILSRRKSVQVVLKELEMKQSQEKKRQHPSLRLVLVPRKPERFDEVADLILGAGFGLVRRSKPDASDPSSKNPVILGDTMGELRKFYSLADVVFVGRTLLDLGHRQHGSDMIEPAALAKPVIVGPFTGNFAEVMARFRAADAMREVKTAEELRTQCHQILIHRAAAVAMGGRAREVVRNEQGATGRHVQLILENLGAANLSDSRHSESAGEVSPWHRRPARAEEL